MKELNDIRDWLKSMHGNRAEIAVAAGVSTKTLSRIVSDDAYNITMKTLKKLSGAKKVMSRKPISKGASSDLTVTNKPI